jgi:hypothetical protein
LEEDFLIILKYTKNLSLNNKNMSITKKGLLIGLCIGIIFGIYSNITNCHTSPGGPNGCEN